MVVHLAPTERTCRARLAKSSPPHSGDARPALSSVAKSGRTEWVDTSRCRLQQCPHSLQAIFSSLKIVEARRLRAPAAHRPSPNTPTSHRSPLPARQVPRSSPLDCDVRTEAAHGAFGKIVRRGTRDLAVLLLLTLQLLCPSQVLLFLHLLSLLLPLLLQQMLLPPTVTLLKHCSSIAVLLSREDSDIQQMFSAYARLLVVEPPLDLFNLLRVACLFGCSRGCTPRSPTVLCSSRMWPGASHFSPLVITEGLSSSLSCSASRSPRSSLSSSCTYVLSRFLLFGLH